MIDISIKFSKNLKSMLLEKGMNQSDPAREIGVASSAVTNWIKARKEPTLSNICKIIKVLNCTFEELVE